MWDNCEKLLKILQNKCALSNNEINKAKEEGKPLRDKNGKELQKIVIGENYQWHKNVLNIKFFFAGENHESYDKR